MTAGVSKRVRLVRHPQSGAAPALDIEVEVIGDVSALRLTYIVRGNIAAVALPKRCTPARVDGLWQHTCFEVFLRGAQAASYWEFNLSPSGQWAAYRFDTYRHGMAAEPAIADPRIELRVDGSEIRLSATVDLSGIEALASTDDRRLGLSAIIKDETGGKSWWSLAHPPGEPDFHHADGFALRF